MFTVFFLFFKYGQRRGLLQNAIKQQRRLVKAAIPALRVNLMNARKWARLYKKRLAKRVNKMLLHSKKMSNIRRIIRRKLKGRSPYVDFVDFSD